MAPNSDGGTDEAAVPQLENYHDPNQSYCLASSLQSPRGVTTMRDLDVHQNDDLAVKYVQRINCELRVMKGSNAEALKDYVQENYENIVSFVQLYRLYDDLYKSTPGVGSGKTKRVLTMEKKAGRGDFGLVPIEPYTLLMDNELV